MPNTHGTNSKNVRDNLVSTEYQSFDSGQPPVHIGQERTGFQAVITSPWIMRWAAIPATYATYRTIRKNSTVALARELAVSPIIASDWTIKADEGVPKEWENYVRDVFMPLRDEYLATALYFGDIDFGYQCWEKIIEPHDGYLKLVRLKQLLHDITEICIGHKGGFIGVRQVGQNLGLNNSIHCGFRVEGSYLYGIPLLENIRTIYNMWTDCNEGARRYDRKIAGSHIVVEYPPGSAFDRYGKETENAILANQILQTLESAGGIAIPRDLAAYMQLLNTNDPGWKIWIMDQGGGHQHSFTDRLEYLDKQFTRGLHIPERAILEGRHGTLAEAEAHGDVIFTIQDIKHRRVTEELNRQAVKQMLYLNFGKEAIKGGHPRVKLVASPIADKQKMLFTQLYTQLLGSPAGQQELASIDMKSMRDQLGIPTHPIDPGDAIAEQRQGQPQLQGIPGVSQGIPGGPNRNLVALDKDGHPVTVDGNQPPQQLAQAMANAIEGMSKAVALSSSTIQKLTCGNDKVNDLLGGDFSNQPEWIRSPSSDYTQKYIDLGKHPNGQPDRLTIYHHPIDFYEGSSMDPEEPSLREKHNLSEPIDFNFTRTDPKTGQNSIDLTGGGKLPQVFGHVVYSLIDWLDDHKPSAVKFHAIEPKRSKAYDTMMELGAKEGIGGDDYVFMKGYKGGQTNWIVHKAVADLPFFKKMIRYPSGDENVEMSNSQPDVNKIANSMASSFEFSNLSGDKRTLPTQSHNFSESIPELVGQSLDMANTVEDSNITLSSTRSKPICPACHMTTVYREDGSCQTCGAQLLKLGKFAPEEGQGLSNMPGNEKEEGVEPYIEHKWDGPKHLILSYRQPGYGSQETLRKTNPALQHNGPHPEEFAGIELYASKDVPGYFQVLGIGVDKSFRRQGYARQLFDHAHKLIKEAGYKGLISHPENRSPDAEAMWSTFPRKKIAGTDGDEWDLFAPEEGEGLSNLSGDKRTLPTQSHNFSGSIPELVGQSLDMDNESEGKKVERGIDRFDRQINEGIENYQMPSVLYHITPRKNLSTISRSGILPAKNSRRRGAYLTDNPIPVVNLSDVAMEDPVAIPVRTKGLKLRIDPEFYYSGVDMEDEDAPEYNGKIRDQLKNGQMAHYVYSPEPIPISALGDPVGINTVKKIYLANNGEETIENREHTKEVRNYELPTKQEWAAARKIIPPQLLLQIEAGIEQLNLGKTGPQIVGIPGTYAGDVVGLHVAVVDGDWIKMHQNPDYVEGDNCLHSKGIVPKGWAYVDRNVYKHDRDPIAMHEITETILEKHGWDYDKAHRSANQFEDDRRRELGIGMANECEEELALTEPLPEGQKDFNSTFHTKLSEIPGISQEAVEEAKNKLYNPRGYIVQALRNAGFADSPDLDTYANEIGEDLLTGKLFPTYDESLGKFSTLFGKYLQNAVSNLRKKESKRKRIFQQNTSETEETNPLVNTPNREGGQPSVRENTKFDKLTGREQFDYSSPEEIERANELREHIGRHLGELGVKQLDSVLSGRPFTDIEDYTGSKNQLQTMPAKIKKEFRNFVEQNGDSYLLRRVDKWLNKQMTERGPEQEESVFEGPYRSPYSPLEHFITPHPSGSGFSVYHEHQEPEEGVQVPSVKEARTLLKKKGFGLDRSMGMAGTLGDTLAARPLATQATQATATLGKPPIPGTQRSSGPARAVQVGITSHSRPTSSQVATNNEDEQELSLSEPPAQIGESYYHSHGHGVPLHEHRMGLPPGMIGRLIRKQAARPITGPEAKALRQYEDLEYGVEEL